MEPTSKLQYSKPEVPDTPLGLMKYQILEALSEVEKQDPETFGVTELVATTLKARNLIAQEVKIDFNLAFTVRAEINAHANGEEEEMLNDLLVHFFPSPEVLAKNVYEQVHAAITPGNAISLSDVVLEIAVVRDPGTPYAEYKEEENPLEETPVEEETVTHHNLPEITFRPSGLPTVLDADSDPFNRVLGMEFELGGSDWKAAFANGAGTVIHLYRKQGKKWIPLCNRRNAQGANGISIQSNRDHRKWCEECERRYANKLVDG